MKNLTSLLTQNRLKNTEVIAYPTIPSIKDDEKSSQEKDDQLHLVLQEKRCDVLTSKSVRSSGSGGMFQ